MLERCRNKTSYNWKNYGGRDIKVCKRWFKFENFAADMGPFPVGYSIERIDNDGNYEPSNCKWIPRGQQTMNRRNINKATLRGKTQSLDEWSKEVGISRPRLRNRIIALGWSVEKAMTTPVKLKTRLWEYRGKSMYPRQWAKHLGINYTTMLKRLQQKDIPKNKIFHKGLLHAPSYK